MARDYDAAVVGLGVMGSALAWTLASRGLRVLALDRFVPPHSLGSSHGRTRILRTAYFEKPLYVPLVRRARALWREVERTSDRTLLLSTGGLSVGPHDGSLVRNTLAAAREADVPHRLLESEELRERYPQIRVEGDRVAVLDEDAGVLLAEACVEALLGLARHLGAELRFGEPAEHWEADGEGVTLTTNEDVYRTRALVLAAGPWSGTVLGPELHLPLEVERQVAWWFEPRADRQRFGPERLPLGLWEYEPDRVAYTLPDLGDGVRTGFHHGGETTDPDRVERSVGKDETLRMRSLLSRTLPDANGRMLEASVCLYTNTPDQDFVVDLHPHSRRVVVVSACSGHGFKFAPAVAEMAASLLGEGESPVDPTPFRLSRFG